MGQAKDVLVLPMSSEYGTHTTIKARLWPWLAGKRPWNLLKMLCSLGIGRVKLGSPYNAFRAETEYTRAAENIFTASAVLLRRSKLSSFYAGTVGRVGRQARIRPRFRSSFSKKTLNT